MNNGRRVWVVLAVVAIVLVGALCAEAALQLPGYATGQSVKADLESKGRKVTDVVTLVVGIGAILGILWGALKIGTGNAEEGKRYVIGGMTAIVIASVVYGIVALVA